MLVYVINQHGRPLMPTKPSKARKLLKSRKAKVIKREPFTIQLKYGSSGYTQSVTLGVDAGYSHIGFSAVTDKRELISGVVEMLSGISERIEERSLIYRRNRRNRKRYRKKRFSSRLRKKGWLAPSIQHKLETHIRIVNQIKEILPISKITIEVAAFEIQKIKNPSIEGVTYQQGEQYGFDNVREYVFARDGHKCQNPNCLNIDKTPILVAHHLIFRQNG